MEDEQIVTLYWNRDEAAIQETQTKYDRYLTKIACNILADMEDSRESVNDTYLAAWNTMPPRRPNILSAFLGKLTRYISLDRWKKCSAQKRGGGQVALSLEELEECISGGDDPEKEVDRKELLRYLNRFLDALPETQRRVFVCRYWYLESVPEIAARFGFSESKVTAMLHRLREKLRARLQLEGLL